jgi:TonB family protein
MAAILVAGHLVTGLAATGLAATGQATTWPATAGPGTGPASTGLLAPAAAVAAEVAPRHGGDWRPHRLARCGRHLPPSGPPRAALEEALELFHLRNGGDAAVVLELGLEANPRSPWLLLLLAQIYLLAGQGEPHCLPSSGQAEPQGDWPRDRARLLDLADARLRELSGVWPDDALVAFLRADVARARDDHAAAAELDMRGRTLCTHMASLDLIRDLRDLRLRAPRVIAPIAPQYPAACVREEVTGEVLLDLLVDPQGRIAEVVVVDSPDRRLSAAAGAAARDAGYQAAQVGYYPVWAWLRVPVVFTLEN